MSVFVAGTFDPFGYESITVADTAIGITSTLYSATSYKALRAIVTAETAQMRYRMDGSDPTASEGHLLNPFDALMLENSDQIAAFRAIRVSASSGVLKVTLMKR